MVEYDLIYKHKTVDKICSIESETLPRIGEIVTYKPVGGFTSAYKVLAIHHHTEEEKERKKVKTTCIEVLVGHP